MQVNRAQLLSALEIVRPGLASKALIEQSTSFAFLGDRVVTYNDEISISHPIEGLSLTGAIEADRFYALLSKVKADIIELEVADGEILLKMGREKAGITLIADVKLPLDAIGEQGKWHPIPKELSAAIHFCKFCCGKDMTKPVLTCVHIRKDGKVEASDDHRISQYQVSKLPIDTFLLPARTIPNVLPANITKIAAGKGWIHFGTDSGTVFSSRVYQDNYPDNLDKFLAVEGIELKLPKTLPDLLEKAEIFSKGDFLLDQKADITVEKNKLKIRTEAGSGWFEAEANIRYDSDPFTFTIHPLFLREIVQRTQTCILGKNIMKFEGENWQHVVALMAK